MKPVLDETGRLIPREDYRLSTLNCGGEDFADVYKRQAVRRDTPMCEERQTHSDRTLPGLTSPIRSAMRETATSSLSLKHRLTCYRLSAYIRKTGRQGAILPWAAFRAKHLLLKEEQTAAYSVEIWKRFRKWGGIPTGITQNVKDLLTSREVSNVFENSDFVYMLNQAQGDREILAKQLNISQQQMTYVTHSEAGEGLIFYGNVILPFIDRFPQDTELYRVMTTKPGEVSA